MADEDLSSAMEETGAETVPTDDVQEPAQTVDTAEQPSEIDVLASELGWRPKAEWQGDESDWVDSRAFIKKSREIQRSTSRELKDVKKQLEGIGKATAAMTRQAVEAERKRLLEQREEAFDAGDRDAYQRIDRELAELKAPPSTTEATPTPEAEAFIEKHSSWFNKDVEATKYAVARADHYAGQGLSPARQLAAVERDMKDLFPDLFGTSKEPKEQKAPPALARPQRQVATQPREKGLATLPAAARKACDDWARIQKENEGWDDKRVASAKEQWAKHYYEQEAANG